MTCGGHPQAPARGGTPLDSRFWLLMDGGIDWRVPRMMRRYINRVVILQRLEVGPFASNCYIVGSEATKEGLIIDPGADAQAILKAVSQLGLTVKLIIATHSHADHIMALAQVKEATEAPYAAMPTTLWRWRR